MEIYNDTYCVYVHINKYNGKMYIGKTIYGNNPNKRWKNGWGYYTQTYFWRAIQKYGWDGFEHEIIASNLTECEASNYEMILIDKLNTRNCDFGYNMTDGGEGIAGYHMTEESKQKRRQSMQKYFSDPSYIEKMRNVAPKRAVCQFTLDGLFVCKYESSMEAERQTGIGSGVISKCAFERSYYAGDYIFVFEEDVDKIEKRVEKYNNRQHQRKEPIAQLSLLGDFIKKWDSAAQAGRELGVEYKNINAVCRGKRNKAGEFKWMYFSDYVNLHADTI